MRFLSAQLEIEVCNRGKQNPGIRYCLTPCPFLVPDTCILPPLPAMPQMCRYSGVVQGTCMTPGYEEAGTPRSGSSHCHRYSCYLWWYSCVRYMNYCTVDSIQLMCSSLIFGML